MGRFASFMSTLTLAACGSFGGSGDGAPPMDASLGGGAAVDGAADGAFVGDAAAPPEGAAPSGELGSSTNPAPSCKAILAGHPSSGSRRYVLSANKRTFEAYCDMTTWGGGWTRIDPAIVDAATVAALRSPSADMMLKCTEAGVQFIVSPPFAAAWSWGSTSPTIVSGQWIVNNNVYDCGGNVEYTTLTCSSWWGVSCGSGALQQHLYAGISVPVSSAVCAGTMTARTNAGFNICGDPNYASYVAFVR